MRVRLESIGCRLNISEIEAMTRALAAGGHCISGPGESADLCILNTCTVTAIASKKSRQLIRQLRRAHPNAGIVVTGCDAELASEKILAAGIDLVVSNADKDHLLDLAEEAGLLQLLVADPDQSAPYAPNPKARTRAFLKVQDGCDNRCSFCVVTIARGAGRSLPAKSIVEEVRKMYQIGYQEVVLSGVHLGSYGHDLGDQRGLFRLVKTILCKTDLPRLRLSSLEPWDLDTGFFDLFKNQRLLPHLHLPLQSGCDETLRRMVRRTNRKEFSKLVRVARESVPDLSISTDVMVGFPGETEEEFEQSLAYVEDTAFSRLHVFRYSRREGTSAATMPKQVPGQVAQERSQKMHLLGKNLENRYNASFICRELEVLWETSEAFGPGFQWSGHTPNYIRVTATTPFETDLLNRVIPTKIVATVPGGVLGEIEDE